MSNQVAQTILQQLGGNRLIAMTGAHSFTGDKDSLTFKVPSRMTKNRIMAVKVTLDPSDTYTVKFYAFQTVDGIKSVKTVADRSGVYCDMLRDVFSAETGLALSL